MMNTLAEGDHISIDSEALSGRTFEVMDVSEESIGLTSVFAVALSDGDTEYLLKGASHSTTADVVTLDDDTVIPIEMADITLVQ